MRHASSSKQKALWASSSFQARTTEERKAYRAKIKANLTAFYNAPDQVAVQQRINAAHAAWIADNTCTT